jgi:hypothetical protein
MPQVGYYDTGPAFDKTFGKKVMNSVRMDLDLSRKGGIFWRKKDVDWKSLDNQKVANLWVDDEIP